MSYIGITHCIRNAINLASLKESFPRNRDKAKIRAHREIQKKTENNNPPINHHNFTKKEADLNPCA